MTRDINPFGLRLPSDLEEKIIEAKEKSGRSKNAEMVYRLQESFRPPLAAYSDGELISELMSRYDRGDIYIRIGKPGSEGE